MELNAFSNMLATWLLAKKLHMQRHTARAPLRCQSCTWWIQEESPRLRKLKISGKLGAQTVLIYLWHRHLRIGSLPKDLSDAPMDIWTKLARSRLFLPNPGAPLREKMCCWHGSLRVKLPDSIDLGLFYFLYSLFSDCSTYMPINLRSQ